MEKDRKQHAKTSRTLQPKSAAPGSVNIVDNRPDGTRNYLSGAPLQRASLEDEEEEPVQGKMSGTAQRVEGEEDDEDFSGGGAIQRIKSQKHPQKLIKPKTVKIPIRKITLPANGSVQTILSTYGFSGRDLDSMLEVITNTPQTGPDVPCFGPTKLRYEGRVIFHQTITGTTERTVFYSYEANGEAKILGIGFHAGRLRADGKPKGDSSTNYNLAYYRSGSVCDRLNVDIESSEVW